MCRHILGASRRHTLLPHKLHASSLRQLLDQLLLLPTKVFGQPYIDCQDLVPTIIGPAWGGCTFLGKPSSHST